MARYISKKFLSPCASETGSMVCKVETRRVKDIWVDEDHKTGKMTVTPHMDCEVIFRACFGEPVSLDLDVRGQRGYEKRVAKLELMISELQAMKGQMQEMWSSHLRDCEHAVKLKKEEQ